MDSPSKTIKNSTISKTERKRQAEALQKLGLSVANLNVEQRAALVLPDNIRAAIEDYIRFPSREARRRQLQYVGRLMRKIDTSPIQDQLAALDGQTAEARYQFQNIERWRDRLLGEVDAVESAHNADAVTEFISHYPQTSRQQLRQLVKRARALAPEDPRYKTASKALFRFLRDTAESHSPDIEDPEEN